MKKDFEEYKELYISDDPQKVERERLKRMVGAHLEK